MKSHRILLEHAKRVLIFLWTFYFSELVFSALFTHMLVYLTYTTPCKENNIILILQKRNLSPREVTWSCQGAHSCLWIKDLNPHLQSQVLFIFLVCQRVKCLRSSSPMNCYYTSTPGNRADKMKFCISLSGKQLSYLKPQTW